MAGNAGGLTPVKENSADMRKSSPRIGSISNGMEHQLLSNPGDLVRVFSFQEHCRQLRATPISQKRKAAFCEGLLMRETTWTNLYRSLGDICTQLLQHTFTKERIRLKQNVLKMGTKLGNRVILIRFSSWNIVVLLSILPPANEMLFLPFCKRLSFINLL